MLNSYYQNSIAAFYNQDNDTILKDLTFHQNESAQTGAWEFEIENLKKYLGPFSDEKNSIIFEYTIPRLAKRIDVVLLIEGIIFVLEYKVGENKYTYQDMDQVLDYALDLKNFHKESENKIVVPILIASNAKDIEYRKLNTSIYHNDIYDVMCANANSFIEIINKVIELEGEKENIILKDWVESRYEPTPTIIEAASALYLNHSVEDITRSDSCEEDINKTSQYILDIINKTKINNEKSIIFLTGVPGAGKTLVGLNVAIEQSKDEYSDEELKDNLAVYLSGNGPLVKVLTAALARDYVNKHKNDNKKCKYTEAKTKVRRFIQEIYNYREQMINKIKTPILNGKLEIDVNHAKPHKDAGYAEIEHVAIFDEAQRAWNHKKLADWLSRGGSYGNKKKVKDFPMSEAEFLIWSMDQRKDWAVILCLVGGGQEIHTGEAGISEWIRAVNETFPHWNVYISDHLIDKEYADGKVEELIRNNLHINKSSILHLATSMRSFRAENLSHFVKALLDLDVNEAKHTYQELKNKYPIVLTRDINKAKQWLKSNATGSERYGIIASSKAERLRPLAIDVKRNADVEHWFLDDKKDLRSSMFLEDIATEFDVQGLELDYTCVAWDGDLRYENGEWKHFQFRNNKWQNINSEEAKHYQINAYRVLLTRARQGMLLFVPKGDYEDETRKPEFYNSTFKFLNELGIEEI